jgi:hypothetical protein
VERYTPLAARVRPEGKNFVSGLFFDFGGCREAVMGGGRGALRPLWLVNEPKKTDARSTGALEQPKPTSNLYQSLKNVRNKLRKSAKPTFTQL